MADASEWQGDVGANWAQEWRRTDRSFGGLTDRLLARTREEHFSQALDIGCGAGELSLAVARGRPEVSVTGVDISPQLLAVARERAANLRNVRFDQGNAADWRGPESPDLGAQSSFQPDLLMSRHGVMFFADPPAAFANLAALAAPGGRLLFSCFRDRSANPFFTEVAALLPTPPAQPDPHAPGPFAFSDSDRVAAILMQGGWSDIVFEAFEFAMIAGAGDDPVGDAVAYFTTIGPVATLFRTLAERERADLAARIRTLAEAHRTGSIVALGATAWLVSARKP